MLERSQRFKKERTELFLNHATQNCMKRAEIFYFDVFQCCHQICSAFKNNL